jgi:hypothetical protein
MIQGVQGPHPFVRGGIIGRWRERKARPHQALLDLALPPLPPFPPRRPQLIRELPQRNTPAAHNRNDRLEYLISMPLSPESYRYRPWLP